MDQRTPNRLINEKSPYLLQHAYNPVDWYPWGEEAFTKTKTENKPVFLSIGYSTCHWCHVMERESFEDQVVAGLLNTKFVPVKVDREERPDIDSIYMAVCQMISGSGGWPLTVILTPEKKPFFAGTYFPRETRYGRTGLIDLLDKVVNLWHERRDEIESSAEQITKALNEVPVSPGSTSLTTELLDEAFNQFNERYDSLHGGFGSSPKFPSPHNLMFLLNYFVNTGEAKALEMAEMTLISMRLGGIYDHLGDGFHRYSTDEEWRLPHFEKMLYDQAMLIYACAGALKITGNSFYSNVIAGIFDYIRRELRSPEGGYFSAEDADSEGEEGKFYVWTFGELRELLKDEFDEFASIFPVDEHGNFVDRVRGGFTGENVIYLPEPLETMASRMDLQLSKLEKRVNYFKSILLEERKKRARPHLDDKILTDWNGLLMAALARAGRYTKNKEYIDEAASISNFVENKLVVDGHLLHRFRDGHAAIDGFLDDYAFYSLGLIEMYKSTFDAGYLELAIRYTEVLLYMFRDKKRGGFYFTSEKAESLPARWKDVYDGAIPSGNSTMLKVLLALYHYTGNDEYFSEANDLIGGFLSNVEKAPFAHSFFLSGLEPILYPSYELVIAGEREHPEIKAALVELTKPAYSNVSVILKDDENSEKLEILAPFTANMTSGRKGCFFYLCRNSVCELPVASATELFFNMQK